MAPKTTKQPITIERLPRLMSSAQTAQYLGIAEGTLHNWRSADTGPDYCLVGRRVMYSAEDVDTWRQAHTVRTRQSPTREGR